MRKVGFFLLSLGIALTTLAAPPERDQATSATALPQTTTKEAWEWTVDERIAIRTDPVARQARIDKFLAQRRTANAPAGRIAAMSNGQELPVGDSIHGSDHPELFLPTELFSIFTSSVFVVSDEVSDHVRKVAKHGAASIGLSSDFVSTFETEALEFTVLQRQENTLKERLGRGEGSSDQLLAEIKKLRHQQCPLRIAAITRLRARYGEKFDRFLYTTVAPGAFIDSFGPTSADELRSQEEGCQ